MDINEGFVLIFRITQRGELTSNQHCNSWNSKSSESLGEISWNLCDDKYYGRDLM